MTRSALLLMFALTVSACDSGSSSGDEEEFLFSVQLQMDGLIRLEGGASYELWARVNSIWVPIERFNYNEGGSLVDLSGRLRANTFLSNVNLAGATDIMVTIEDRRDADEVPSSTVVATGGVTANTATMVFAAGGGAMGSVTATYAIGTPNDSDPSNETFGIWLGTSGAWTPTMTAPVFSDGWEYELWIELGGTPVSLGKFSDPSERDRGAPFSSTPETFSIPGESFIDDPPAGIAFPLSPAGSTVFVSLEPVPDDLDGTPYGIRVLQDEVPAGAAPGQQYPFPNVLDPPTGTATLR